MTTKQTTPYAVNYIRLHPSWPQNKRLRTPWTTDWMHTRQDRWIQTELTFTLVKNATKPNPFDIISLQTTRKKNNWKTEEMLAKTIVTLKTERIKGSNPWCLWWWWWWIKNPQRTHHKLAAWPNPANRIGGSARSSVLSSSSINLGNPSSAIRKIIAPEMTVILSAGHKHTRKLTSHATPQTSNSTLAPC